MGSPSRRRLALACALFWLGCSPTGGDAELAARCPAVLADAALPTTPSDAVEARAAGRRWDDRAIRELYLCRVRRIGAEDEAHRAAGLDAETRARRAFETRHGARLTARAMMADAAQVAALEARDRAKYGAPDGPSWDWLVERARDRGLSGDAVYLSIVESAQKTNAAVDESLGL
ncbi:MAG: hypothetical protein IT373_12650 [Polyangiaceae bacterium]|nr:hypothetical protein [Polyangiaceae bacterium]